MKFKKLTLLATLVLSSLSGAAHADLQKWRLSATVYSVSEGFTAPAFAALGRTVTVDYLIETSATPSGDALKSYPGALGAVFVNGQYTTVDGDVFSLGTGLAGINTALHAKRSDRLGFLSFNRFNPAETSNLTELLMDISAATPGSYVDFRMDFGSDTVHAHPASFEQLKTFDVPEPGSVALLVSGLWLAGAIRRRASAQKRGAALEEQAGPRPR
ncbi:PEP-CTERM sorting domain-containing protein [Mitsuaria sp. WAJ17]|uniref:PEP-CTERM sorting domain-containing protein n=1 Tax=Mitsuaria sp. WAJ17 TaxID=2761452 RepID=UPI0015FFCB3E|nr:PEP-CTERM sorting domain-containing protein [Mitsuaria sp. WAJ17]MBB2484087.1 PEP-CTERM sorting domain-containing protein [Mitsuaria sp. WAJ17]